MAHACTCHTHASAGKSVEPITSDLTVSEVAHHYPGGLDALKSMGINHCCGAHLTLREAAASAGIPLDTLLEALNRPAVAKP